MFRSKMCFSDTHRERICPKTVFLSTQGRRFITFLETSSAFPIKKNGINTLIGRAKNSFPETVLRTRLRGERLRDIAPAPA